MRAHAGAGHGGHYSRKGSDSPSYGCEYPREFGSEAGEKGHEKMSLDSPILRNRLSPMTQGPAGKERKYSIVLYSDDSSVRASIIGALGTRVSADMAEHEIHEFATGAALRLFVDAKKPGSDKPIDLFILDGESVPEGGLGIARQLKDEVFNCPPVLVITGRKADAWLAAWSRAEANVLHPIDPFTLSHTVAELLRARTTSLSTL